MDQRQAILSAIAGYFDLMYNADDQHFPEVFHPSSFIHGMRNGSLVAWSAADFREVMRNRPSPAAMMSPRDQAILNIEHTEPDLAVAKVRVRIGQTGYIDTLVFHCISDEWLVTSKTFHIARTFPEGS